MSVAIAIIAHRMGGLEGCEQACLLSGNAYGERVDRGSGELMAQLRDGWVERDPDCAWAFYESVDSGASVCFAWANLSEALWRAWASDLTLPITADLASLPSRYRVTF